MDLAQPRTTASRPYAYCADEYMTIDGMPFDLCGTLRGQHGMNIVFTIYKGNSKWWRKWISVYVPFVVDRITDEMKIDIQLSSNSIAMWNMEINQIECTHMAALVTPDERQGLTAFHLSIFVCRSEISFSSTRWLPSIFLPIFWSSRVLQLWKLLWQHEIRNLF